MGLNLIIMTEDELSNLQVLGNKLRNFRNGKNYSQEKIAELTGLDRTYISGLERGKRNPSYIIISKLLKVLEISSNQLFEGDE